jgi:hypothetical protein
MDTFGEIVMSIPENHMEMCKFATRDNVGYVRVSYRIERLCSAAIGALREGTADQSNVVDVFQQRHLYTS